MDFVHDILAGGRTIRILTAIDAFTRECVALVAQRSFKGCGSSKVCRGFSLNFVASEV